MNNKLFKIIYYYLLLFLGLIITSWIIWARFIRERAIRDIPDNLLTEYRFWILCYICIIYLYAIKRLIKPKEGNMILLLIVEYLYKPLEYLDKFVKYTLIGNEEYFAFSRYIINFLKKRKKEENIIIVICFSIIPRLCLIWFLVVDIFYFYKLEIFYKVIAIGLIPFIFRYFKYSIKDIYNFWILQLEEQYASVLVFRKGFAYVDFNKDYDPDDSHERFERMDEFYNIITAKDNDAKYHYKEVTIKEYIELQFTNKLEYMFNDIKYEYIGKPRAHLLIKQKEYEIDQKSVLKIMDDHSIHELFHNLLPDLMELKFYLKFSMIFNDNNKIIKIIIFLLYFLCWSFILIISCYIYPVKFHMSYYFLKNILFYLTIMDDPFVMDSTYSQNQNLFTIENIKYLMIQILKRLSQWFY